MALVALYASIGISKDAGGSRTASRVWRADNANSAGAARAMFEADPTLKIHPDDPTIPFDRADVVQDPDAPLFKVLGVWSTFRGGRLAPEQPPRDDPNWYQFDRGRRRGESEIAVNSRQWRKSDNQSFEPFQVWVLARFKVDTLYPRLILRRRFRGVVDQSIFDPIDKQLGSIHRFPDGQYGQFVDAETKQIASGDWDVSYTWEFDPGTLVPNPPVPVAEWNGTNYPIPVGLVAGYARPPFGRIVDEIQPAEPRTTVFRVTMGLVGRLDDDGWRTLPGTEVL